MAQQYNNAYGYGSNILGYTGDTLVYFISVSDSITATESPSLGCTPQYVSVSDIVDVAEFAALVDSEVSVGPAIETITASESAELYLPVDLSVSELIAITEEATLYWELNLSVEDRKSVV